MSANAILDRYCMALILCIETATPVCSAALVADGRVLSFRETSEPNAHSKSLTLFLQSMLEETGKHIQDLNAIAVSMGPGSYTGLRIGVSTAKGLAYAADLPVIGIDTLDAMSIAASEVCKDSDIDYFVPMIDARRMEVYAAVFDKHTVKLREVQSDIVSLELYAAYLNKGKVLFFGDGADKTQTALQHDNAVFDAKVLPSSRFMATIAERKFSAAEFENLAYFEPHYLKEFIALTPTKHIYG